MEDPLNSEQTGQVVGNPEFVTFEKGIDLPLS